VGRRGLLVAAAGALLARPALARGQGGDARVLARLIEREEAAAFAHRAARTGHADDEAAHAAALRTQLAALGLRGPEPPTATAELSGAARRLAGAGAPPAVLDAAIAMEASLISAYARALEVLAEPAILQTAATILASHGQHRALLRRKAGRDPLP
jgi:hypothetical protein